MSRGIETIETVFPTGSSEATIIVSVRKVWIVARPESTPISSTFTRGIAGVADGPADDASPEDGTSLGRSEGSGLSMPKSGSSDATAGGLPSGTQAPPSPTGW